MIQEHDSIIVQTVSRFLIPLIQIYGLYVLMFGQFGPGGGFVAGVIIGASVILMVLVFGLDESHSGLVGKMLHGDGVGLLIYAGVGGLCLIGGGEFLNYAKLEIPVLDAPSRRFIGIL
ncbi:MAG: MnhB domain-containing protein, partial [Nitrospirales bacterium]